jgi:hypothetical protein
MFDLSRGILSCKVLISPCAPPCIAKGTEEEEEEEDGRWLGEVVERETGMGIRNKKDER